MEAATIKEIQKDVPEAINIVEELQKQVLDINQSVKTLSKRVKDGNFQSTKGLSFLEVKNQMLLSYITNLGYLMYQKINGRKIQGDSTIDRLVETRTVLEKMRPIDQKLKYQIDKLLTSATTGNINADDPLRFKANPENLLSKTDDAEDSEEEEEDDEQDTRYNKGSRDDRFKSSKVYVPPKLTAMHYSGDETVLDQKQKLLDRAKKRALSSSIMQELRREYDEGPEEIRESKDLQRLKDDKQSQRKTEYEEEYFMRLPITKQEKHKSRQVATMSSLGDITRFEDISALDADVSDFQAVKKKKMSKKPIKKGKKGGFRKRKWK